MPEAGFRLGRRPDHAYMETAPRVANHLPRGGLASMVRPRNGA